MLHVEPVLLSFGWPSCVDLCEMGLCSSGQTIALPGFSVLSLGSLTRVEKQHLQKLLLFCLPFAGLVTDERCLNCLLPASDAGMDAGMELTAHTASKVPCAMVC